MMRFSANIRELEESATLAVAALARKMKDEGHQVIDLSIGEPDFRTPDFAAQAGVASIVQGFTHYTPVAGVPALRKLIAEHLARTFGREMDPAGVVTTAGAKHALFNACFCLFGPGDRVLLPAPFWTSYPELIKIARAEPAIVPTTPEGGFKVDTAVLDAHYDDNVRGLILNSPSNPTGAVYSVDEIDAIGRWAADRGISVISDEIYDRIYYEGQRAPGVLDLDPSLFENTVLVNGASKAFAMTGWRLGFSYSNPALAKKMADLQSHVTSNISSPAQYAGMAIYRSEPRVEHAVRAMVGVFRHRRERLVSLFHKHLPQVQFEPPAGSFYMFFRVDNFFRDEITDSISFCRWLLETTGVALVPGAAFGEDRYVRLSFAAPEDELVEAVRRMGEVLAVPAMAG